MEPSYSFTIPSMVDETILDCRLYNPDSLHAGYEGKIKGALLAHPYAPLGGSQDDAVVLAVAQSLLDRGYIVGTFNFRGAGESHGRTSWTAKGEKDDYMTVIGFLLYYLEVLAAEMAAEAADVSVLLAGYSYGSLILTQLPPVASITETYAKAEIGTSIAEVILRARLLANETAKGILETHTSPLDRGRRKASSDSRPESAGRAHAHSATVTLGGEETNPSERRISRDAKDGRRGIDIIKKTVDVPHRIKTHLHKRSSSNSQEPPKGSMEDSSKIRPNPVTTGSDEHTIESRAPVKVRYLLISPLLPPLAHTLVPPQSFASLMGRQHGSKVQDSGFGSFNCGTFVAWGSHDSFTSHKRLNAWAERIQEQAPGVLTFAQIDGASHFWREPGAMKQLLQRISDWDNSTQH